jgi:uncharacterized damage-inducible protein DinB
MPETAQQYTQRLLSYTDGKQPLSVQRATPKKLAALTKRMDKKKLTRRPQPDKWSVAEILAHLADAELVIGWRLRSVLGASGNPIQAYDQDVWANTFQYKRRHPKASIETFRVLRESNLALLKTVPKDLWENYGMHQERGKESIAHIVKMVAGHDLNHLQQLERIVKEGRGK